MCVHYDVLFFFSRIIFQQRTMEFLNESDLVVSKELLYFILIATGILSLLGIVGNILISISSVFFSGQH